MVYKYVVHIELMLGCGVVLSEWLMGCVVVHIEWILGGMWCIING